MKPHQTKCPRICCLLQLYQTAIFIPDIVMLAFIKNVALEVNLPSQVKFSQAGCKMKRKMMRVFWRQTCFGFRTSCIAALSTYMCESSTSGYSEAMAVTLFLQRIDDWNNDINNLVACFRVISSFLFFVSTVISSNYMYKIRQILLPSQPMTPYYSTIPHIRYHLIIYFIIYCSST